MIRPAVCTRDGQPILGKATFEEHVEHQFQHEYNRCIHFQGRQQTHCKAGVLFPRGSILPCWRDVKSPHACALQQFPTEGEALCMARERIAAISAALWQMRIREQARQCIHCGATYGRLVQAGPCVYAEPCGHRQWQGTIPKAQTEG